MLYREKLQSAIQQAILPYATETSEEDVDNSFVTETAIFLAQEIIHSEIDITETQAELDDDDLENLPITQILTPHFQQLLSVQDTLSLTSTIIQIYTLPEPDPETHRHIRTGQCEVLPHQKQN
jgi:hypothetical protein